MAKIKTYTEDQLKKARRSGLKAKRPKKPKAGATLRTMENYIKRYNEWVDKIKAGAKKYEQKEADKKKRERLRNEIRKI